MNQSIRENRRTDLVLGVGITGAAVLKYLSKSTNEKVLFWDGDNRAIKKIEELKIKNTVYTTLQDIDWSRIDKIFASPGIDLKSIQITSSIELARKHKCHITNDLQFFCDFIACPKSTIGITGTNGKSTTTAMIAHILQNCGFSTQALGNIGKPIFEYTECDFYAIEISSFQLELCSNLELGIAIMLSITPDHLDRHKTFENYINIKASIFANLSTAAIVCVDADCNKKVFSSLKNKKKIAISTINILERGFSMMGDTIFYNQKAALNIKSNLIHQKENMLAAYVCAKLLGLNDSDIKREIECFAPLLHRMEFVKNYKNVQFINDSKATNPESTQKALNIAKNIYWLAGGSAKKGLNSHGALNLNNVRKAYFFGQASDELFNMHKTNVQCQKFKKMEDALYNSFCDSQKDGASVTILLSPSLPSFDEFKNFEERGNFFKKLVSEITCSFVKTKTSAKF